MKQKYDSTSPSTSTGAIILVNESPMPLKMLNSESFESLSNVKRDPSKMPTGIAFPSTFGSSYKRYFPASISVQWSVNTFFITLTSVSGAIQTIIKSKRHTSVALKTCLNMYLSNMLIFNTFFIRLNQYYKVKSLPR